MVGVVVLVVGLGCSSDKLRSVGGGEDLNSPAPAAAPPAKPPSSRTAILRLLGDNQGDYSWVSATVRDVAVEANGVPLHVTRGKENVNLANTSQAWLLGKFSIPNGVDKVKVTIRFDDFGSFVDTHSSGWVDFRGSPITVELSTADMVRNGHAVLKLDVAKMLAKTARPEERIATNRLMVRY